MITALLFVSVTTFLYVFAIVRGPFWGLLAYVNVYFNTPDPFLNWWASYLPFHSWSALSTGVLLFSMIIRRDLLSDRKLKTVKYVFLFLFLTFFINYTIAQFPQDSTSYAKMLLSFVIMSYCIVRIVKTEDQFRLFWLVIVGLAGYLSFNAYLYGNRVNGRLERFGTSDSYGANEFSLLLVAILPFVIPFLVKGRPVERLVSFLCLPFIVNGFILCNSRGAVVAFAASFFVSVVVVTDGKTRLKMLTIGIVLLSLTAYLADDELINRISTLVQSNDTLIEDDDHTNRLSSGRLQIWGYGLDMVSDYPYGAGANGFKNLARFYMPEEVLSYDPGAKFGVRAAHNSYLQVVVEQGYLGLIIWLLICGVTLQRIYSAFLRTKRNQDIPPFWRYCIFSMGVSYLSILLGSLFTSRVYYEFFWWQVAMAVVLSSLVSEVDKNIENL